MDKPNISPEKNSDIQILMAADASAEPENLAPLLSSDIKVATLDPKGTSIELAQQLTQGVSAILLLVSFTVVIAAQRITKLTDAV
jgi:hypothetical protein